MKSYGLIYLKSTKEIEIMHESNCIVHDVLNYVGEHLKPGVSTSYLDSLAEERLNSHGARSAFKNYKGFPKVLCVSVNEEVVHGIPRDDKIIQDGDIVSLDFGVYHKGYAGDSAKTFVAGSSPSLEISNLIKHTHDGLVAGINAMQAGNRLYDIGSAIESVAKKYGYGNLLGFCGHGIGKKMHENPHVFNWVCTNEPNIRLREGMVFALEPMFTLGTSDVNILEDGWTVVTKDKSMAVHWELSIAITKDGPCVLGTETIS